ncbi:MAG: hypothetical protein ACYC69_02710 [Thermodesulfovibrionales bacterium]
MKVTISDQVHYGTFLYLGIYEGDSDVAASAEAFTKALRALYVEETLKRFPEADLNINIEVSPRCDYAFLNVFVDVERHEWMRDILTLLRNDLFEHHRREWIVRPGMARTAGAAVEM